MTERLSTLLREEATDLTIPVPDAQAILRHGKGVRRRRRAGSVVAGAAAVAVVVAGFAALSQPADHTGRGTPPASERAVPTSGAFAAGSTVWPEGATHPSVTVDGQVKSVYYTSEGVVARVGDNPYSDDPGPSRYVAINGDQPPRDLGIDLGDRVPSTDATQPYLAYADATPDPDRWDVVVVDVRDGSEAGRVTVDGAFTWGGWEAPPVSLSGDHVYVGLDDATVGVDWETGETDAGSALAAPTAPTVVGGRATTYDRKTGVAVVEVQTGEVLLQVPAKRQPYVSLSPDGRFAKVVFQDTMDSEDTFEVHDLASGEQRTVEGPPWDYGWTPNGDLLKVGKGEATVCQPFGDGGCSSEPVDLGKGDLRLAGLLYES